MRNLLLKADLFKRAASVAMVTWEGAELRTLKQHLGRHLGITETLQVQGCLCCSPTSSVQTPWQSKEGEREYAMSTVCETCFDALFISGHDVPEQHSITKPGLHLMRLWIAVSKASHALKTPVAIAARLQRWMTGAEPWPSVRRAPARVQPQ